jgi:hypothetical protein
LEHEIAIKAWMATSFSVTNIPISCACLIFALLLLVCTNDAIITETALVFAVLIAIHGASRRRTLRIKHSSMPRRQGKPNQSWAELDSSSEETESSPSPPRPPRQPGHTEHRGRRNDHRPTRAPNPHRQPVERLGPPRPGSYHGGRQMTRLDVEWEVRQLERARRQQPESFSRRPASSSASVAEVASRGFAVPRPIPTLEEATRLVDEQRLRASQQDRGRRERRGRAQAAVMLTYNDARTLVCI